MRNSVGIYMAAMFFLFSCEVGISEEQSDTFIKFYGNYLLDSGSDVVKTDEGGYAVAGTTSIPDSVTAMVLMKTDEYGNLLRRFPRYYTDGRDCGTRYLLKLDDGFLLCGYVMADGIGGRFQEDICLIRTTIDGSVVWRKTFGGNGDENVNHVVEGNSDGFVIAGYRELDNEKDYWIFSISGDGDFIREVPPQPIPDNSDDMANCLVNVQGMGYLCACTYNDDTHKGTNVLMLAINNDLNTPYNISLGTDGNDYGKALIKGETNTYYVLGNTRNESSGKMEIFVYSLEMDGLRFINFSEFATIRSDSEDLTGERFVMTAPGSFAIIGSSGYDNNYDILLQFVEQGIPSGRFYFGETGNQTGAGILVSDDGGLVFVGTNTYEGNSMISLVKTNINGEL